MFVEDILTGDIANPSNQIKPKESTTFKMLTLFTLHSSARSAYLYILVISALLVLLRILVLMNNLQWAVNFQKILFVKFFFTSYHSLIKRTPTLNPSPRTNFKWFSCLFLHSGLKIWPNSNLTKNAWSEKNLSRKLA